VASRSTDESLIHVPHLSAAHEIRRTEPLHSSRRYCAQAPGNRQRDRACPGDGRIYIELVNAAFLMAGGTAEQFRAGIQRAVDKGWMVRHESGTYVKFTPSGAELFA
jgi:hypothetical protein